MTQEEFNIRFFILQKWYLRFKEIVKNGGPVYDMGHDEKTNRPLVIVNDKVARARRIHEQLHYEFFSHILTKDENGDYFTHPNTTDK